MIRTTGQNIISEIEILSFAKDFRRNRWEFKFQITKSYIEPLLQIEVIERLAILENTPAFYEEGVLIEPEGTEVSDFESMIPDYPYLEQESMNIIVAHAETLGLFNDYVDNTNDLWDNEGIPADQTAPAWVEDVPVAVGFLREYQGIIYRCITKHTTQLSWEPDITPSLWMVVPVITESGYPNWAQPLGSHDAYGMHVIVTHNGFNWKSLNASNIWEPSDSVPTLWEKLI